MMYNILVTGGKGKLGRELEKLIVGEFLDVDELDITDRKAVVKEITSGEYEIVIHLAANTDLNRCQKDKEEAYEVNVMGTRNVSEACRQTGAYLVYPSTDYVFNGAKGMYKEEDAPDPVNYYALTKLLGEYEVRRVHEHLVLRGTMKERGKWRHPFAPTDMYASLLHHDEFAELLVELVERTASGTFHLGKGRYSVYEWAHRFDEEVRPKTLAEIGFPLPKDCSLDTEKLERFLKDNPEPIIEIRKKWDQGYE